jgi:hypothetical protein
MNKKVLYVNWGGLGDHLQFSTLPEQFNRLGYDFYISDKSHFRSDEIYDLVWGSNPYVKGITTETANCGHIENWGVSEPVKFDKNLSMHANIERIYGINPISDFPALYYKPNNLSHYNDHILIDLNAYSVADYPHNLEIILNHIKSFTNEKILYVSSESSYGKPIIDLSDIKNINTIKTKNIFHYIDLIYSSKKFISLWSGGSHISASIKHHFKNDLEIECLKVQSLGPNDWGDENKSFFWYNNINYIIC